MTGQEFLDALVTAGAEPFDLSEWDQCEHCGMIRGGHTIDCETPAFELYEAFLTGIAACIRARLVARAMDGRDVRVVAADSEFEASRWLGGWCIMRWRNGQGEDVATIAGPTTDTAAEVVDALLRIAAEWAGER